MYHDRTRPPARRAPRRRTDEEEAAAEDYVDVHAPLADARLTEPGSGPVRTALVLRVQRTAGNTAVQALLRAAAAPAASNKHATGEEADQMIAASALVGPYVRDKIKAGTRAAGHVHDEPREEFQHALAEHYKRGQADKSKEAQEGAELFARQDVEGRPGMPPTDAFTAEGEIHMRQDRGDYATTIHEAMHLYSEKRLRDTAGKAADEGAAEYFARIVCRENGIERAPHYAARHDAVAALGRAVGDDLLAAAYFNGEVDQLADAVDAATQAGTWAYWIGDMDTGKFEIAKSRLHGAQPTPP